MSAAMLKRKRMMDTQRENNRAAWLKGYQKAQELDEEARKNNMTIGETTRYHDKLIDLANRKGDQGDTRLQQNQQRIDLAKLKYTDDKQYKDDLLAIKKAESEGRISHWEAQDAISKMREQRIASKAESSSQGNKSTAGYWHEYYEMMETPEGQKKVRDVLRKIKAKDANPHNIRYIMDKLKGRSSSSSSGGGGGGKKPSQHRNTTRGNSGTGGKKRPQPY